MTEVLTHDRATTKRKRSNGAAHAPVLVSSYKLAAHFGVARQYIDQLTAVGVIERRSDGYDQDACRCATSRICATSNVVHRAARLMQNCQGQDHAVADQDRGEAAHLGAA